MNTDKKSGFVALIGRPNVGKSTLLNQVIGQKIAIMSNKPQTTRNKIHGVYTEERGQVIFIDTPGIHKPKSKLGDYMVKVAENTLKEVDLILLLVDASVSPGPGEKYILKRLEQVRTPVFLVLNKIDQVHPEALLPLIDEYRELYSFAEYIPISAIQGNNIGSLKDQIFDYLPEGPAYYPENQVTDHPEQFIVAELIREKVLHLTREEVPHSIAVTIEEMKKPEDSETVHIYASIFTERPSQKKIIIGRQGAMLKEIGKRARRDIERLLGNKVYLDLWVKVREDWRNKQVHLRNFGFREDE
ncbi:MAG: GTPase Era [Bacillaceae bacterium]|nr:GTPase Era [Bacillaceae bacterium]